jgi:hypothetical protein
MRHSQEKFIGIEFDRTVSGYKLLSDSSPTKGDPMSRAIGRFGLLAAAAVTGAVLVGVAAPAMAADHAPAKASAIATAAAPAAANGAPAAKGHQPPSTRSSNPDRPQIFAKSVMLAVYNRSGQTVKVYDADKDRTTSVAPGERVYLRGSSFAGPDVEGSMTFENGIKTNFWANNHDMWWPGVQFDDDDVSYSEYDRHTYTPGDHSITVSRDADWDYVSFTVQINY